MTASDPAALRRSFYLLLTVVAVAIAAAKVVGVENVTEPSRYAAPTGKEYGSQHPDPSVRKWPTTRPEPSPMFGSNDRSRWATIRALVEDGTYVVGRRTNLAAKEPPFGDTGIVFDNKDYETLDKVMNPDTGEFYSSKPPLFATLLAGEYWVLKHLFGWSIDRDRWWVVCFMLLTVNVLPFAIYLVLLSRLIEDYGTTDFGKLLVFATACCGTFLTTFSATLNNHNPAAYCVLFAVYPLLSKRGAPATESRGKLFVSGFFAGLAVTLELPALALLIAMLVPLVLVRPSRAMVYFVPGMLLPLAAMLVCNTVALGRLLPAYSDFGGPWYEYAGSHWLKRYDPNARGIDFANEPKAVYALHLLFGHHGWFSLTPVWIVAGIGLLRLSWASRPTIRQLLATRTPGPDGLWTLPFFGAVASVVSIVVIGFYVWKTNNYGGFTSGPRWLFWLTPLWLLGMLPAADQLATKKVWRVIAAVLLGLSVLSVFYPAWNPWRPPWILQGMEVTGWIRY
jgi:hypothetical protein